MLKKLFFVAILTHLPFFPVSSVAEVLCDSCEVSWIDTELSNGDLRFASVSGVGSGPCAGTFMTTMSTVTESQRDQIMSVLLTAMMSGTKITAHGSSTACGSFNLLTIYKP